MSRRIVAESTTEVISLSEMKNYLKVSSSWSDDDVLIASMIKASTLKAEDYLWAALTEKTYEQFFNCYQSEYEIRFSVNSIESVKYYDSNNNDQTLTVTTDYLSFNATNPAIVRMVNSFSVYDRPDAVRITYKSGKTDGKAVDDRAKQAIRWVVTEMYDKRMNDIQPFLSAFHRLLFPIRNLRF